MYNASCANIIYHLKKLKVYKGKRDTPRKNPKKDEVVTLVKEGLSTKEICDKLNVSTDFVRMTLKEKGLKTKSKSLKDDIIKEWKELSSTINTYKEQKDALCSIANKYSLAKRNLEYTLRKSGFILMKDFSLQEKKDQIVKLFKEGVTPIEIGSRLDCSKTYVYQVLEENGISRNRPKQESVITEEDEKDIAELYKDGKNATQLAVKYKTSSEHIYEILKKQGVELRTKKPRISQDVLDNIISLTGQMMPKEIAAKLGISVTTVYNVQKEHR